MIKWSYCIQNLSSCFSPLNFIYILIYTAISFAILFRKNLAFKTFFLSFKIENFWTKLGKKDMICYWEYSRISQQFLLLYSFEKNLAFKTFFLSFKIENFWTKLGKKDMICYWEYSRISAILWTEKSPAVINALHTETLLSCCSRKYTVHTINKKNRSLLLATCTLWT